MNKTQWNRTVPKKHRALMLRTCAADMTSYCGFVWPVKGYVEAPDWDSAAVCGNGLHGALWGEGDGTLFSWESDAVWLVVEVDDRQIVDLNGKAKVPRGWVLYAGDRLTATGMMPVGKAVIGGNATAGHYGTATAGNGGQIQIKWWDGMRDRLAIGYVGEDGIKADVAYHVVDGKLVPKE